MLPGYWIGKYPVTVAQFREFAADYRWADRESLQGPDNHPMANVTWRHARDYCRWLAQITGLPVTLPSEAEWEKAARGTDGRLYPWGNELPDARLCNFGHNVDRTTPVGQYSTQGDSPFGCADMAGNVWEWTRSLWGKDWGEPDYTYPYRVGDGREDLEAGNEVLRVLRGGSYDRNQDFARCAFRKMSVPNLRDGNWYNGFRVCVVPRQE